MGIAYKRLTETELETFIDMRITQLTEEYEAAGKEVPKLGHRHIAFISGPVVKKEISRTRRLAGLQQYYKEAGLDPALIKLFCPTLKAYADYPHTGAEYQTGYDMTIRALDADTPATAFVGNSDDIAFGILAALADRGI